MIETNRFWKWLLGIYVATISIAILASVAFGQEGPYPEIDLSGAGEGLAAGIGMGAWLTIGTFGGMLLVGVLRYALLPNLKGTALAWTSVVLIAVATFLGVLAENPKNWPNGIVAAIASGLSAAQAWRLMPAKIKDPIKTKIAARS